MGRFIKSILLVANLLFGVALALSYWAPVTNPSDFWHLAIFGILAPYILLVNVIFILFWLVIRKWYLVFSLAIILLGWKNISKIIVFNSSELVEEGRASLKLMTYNVQNFDLYNWTENEESRDNMLRLIKEQDPDIITFQEFYTDEDDENFHNIKLLVNELEYKHFHFEKTLTLKEKNHWGLATFSKYPLSNKNRVDIEGSRGNLITYCDVELPYKDLRLFNVHLQSIGFGKNDYKFFKKFSVQNPDIESSKNILKKLKDAYIKRAEQAELLGSYVDHSPLPVIVCGDFNDTPLSYVYEQLNSRLTDSYQEVGFGLGGTYAGPLPSFRIDYVFVDSSIQVSDFDIIKKNYSDHYPVSVVLGI